MANFPVQLIFEDSTISGNTYIFPLVQSVSDASPGMKATVIKGTRADGSIVIPGGQESIEIRISGILFADGYVDLTTLMDDMRSKVTTNIGTLTLQHFDGDWQVDWEYAVRRITPIEFPESDDFRTQVQKYELSFLVVSY